MSFSIGYAHRVAVILDMDGLILDTEALMRRAWQAAARECGTTIDDDLYSRFIGLGARDTDGLLRAVFGDDFPFTEFYQLGTNSFEACISEHGAPLKPGLLELFNFLDAYGYLKAVATSTDHRTAIQLLDRAGVLPRIDLVVGGDQVRHAKPEPDIFLRAAQLLGIPPSDCLVLEDSTPGIQAAVVAGMTSILVPDLTQPTLEVTAQVLAVVESLHHAIPYIEAWVMKH